MSKPAFSIYDASAGSGKTYTLVKEYLKIILLSKNQDAYRNILAITFTNKAVHEMKSRVVESLSEFAKDEPSQKAQDLIQDLIKGKRKEDNPQEWAEQPIGLSIIQIKTKSQQIIKHLIHNYAAFDISTIDKFTHKVIRAFAHDLNLPITFEVSLDTESLLTEAVDAIIAQAGEDETLTNLLVNFTMEKTDDDKSWDVSREIMETGKLILNENNREEISHFNNKSIAEFVEIKNRLLSFCKELMLNSIELASDALELIENNGIDHSSFYGKNLVPNHFLKISNGNLIKHENNYKYLEDGNRYSKATPQNQKESIDEIADDLLAILKQINEIAEKYLFYEAFLKNITPLSLMNTLSNKLQEIQKEQNVLSISEFNKLINEQIQNQPAPFIYERLGEKYQHFFIDEFQDTSEMQWQNLIPLIDNALSSEDLNGERGSLMIVGDPKQSIYRWRGGKAEQFIELSKEKNPFSNKDKKLFTLETNYRSYSQVIDFNNNFFKFLASKFVDENYADLYENHSHQLSNSKIGGYVNLSFITKIEEDFPDEESLDKTDLYLEATLNTILKVKKSGFNYKDIVILTRKKDPGIAIANHLIENGIPIVSSESLLLGASSEVQTCIYILRYLKNSNDLEAKANFLYYLASNHQDTLPIHDFISIGMELKNEIDFQNYLAEIDLDFSFQNIRKKALYEATEIIISKIIFIEKRNAYIQYFLDLILEHDLKKQSGISDFLYYWENNSEKLSIPSPEGNDAVRIMTIHKSKGLEFPVVIFPFAEENYSQYLSDKIWIAADEAKIGLPRALVSKNKDVANFGEEASKVYNQKKEEDLLDNINVLYVALTRAEEQLYIISGIQSKSKKTDEYPNNMASFFIEFLGNEFKEDQLDYEFGSPEKISTTKEVISNAKIIPQLSETLHPKNIKIAQRESIMWNTKQQKAIEYGNSIHEILAFVKTKNDIDLAITKAIENGLIRSNQKEEVYKTISEVVNHKELNDYFSDENKIMNEQTIIQKQANLVKPDRMAISKDKKVFLLDYKTGQHLPKYKTQLENYQKSIEDMGYKVEKKALIYIGEEIEVVHL